MKKVDYSKQLGLYIVYDLYSNGVKGIYTSILQPKKPFNNNEICKILFSINFRPRFILAHVALLLEGEFNAKLIEDYVRK